MRRALFALLPLPLLSLAVCTPTGDDDDESPAPPTLCETLELPERAWNADGPYGLLRRELIEDFTIELLEEDDWVMSERWSGCESYVFVPDSLNVHQTDPTSLWEQGIADLVGCGASGLAALALSACSICSAIALCTLSLQAANLCCPASALPISLIMRVRHLSEW